MQDGASSVAKFAILHRRRRNHSNCMSPLRSEWDFPQSGPAGATGALMCMPICVLSVFTVFMLLIGGVGQAIDALS
jgi:hypothetical protein